MSLTQTNDTITGYIDQHAKVWWGLASALHARPELGLTEYFAADLLTARLDQAGLRVRRDLAGMPTAFRADAGAAGDDVLCVAFTAEYDALPGIGHACGHNLMAAMAVAAGEALAQVADTLGFRVAIIGCPAEENAGGKIYLAEDGVFDDVHAAAQIHPANRNELCPATLANDTYAVEYIGKAAHASSFPERGRNAYDAITIANVALGLLRQQLPSSVRLHTLVTDTGQAVNIIPDHTAMTIKVRAADCESLDDIGARVRDCLEAGGLAAGCETRITRTLPRFAEIRYDRLLARLFARSCPRFEEAHAPIMNGDETYVPASGRAASTDVGNLSWVVPTIQPMLRLETGGCGNHEARFAEAAISPSARLLLLDGAKALAHCLLAAATEHGDHYRAAGSPERRRARLAAARQRSVLGLGVPLLSPVPSSP